MAIPAVQNDHPTNSSASPAHQPGIRQIAVDHGLRDSHTLAYLCHSQTLLPQLKGLCGAQGAALLEIETGH